MTHYCRLRPLMVLTLTAAVAIGGIFYGVLRIVTDTSEDW